MTQAAQSKQYKNYASLRETDCPFNLHLNFNVLCSNFTGVSVADRWLSQYLTLIFPNFSDQVMAVSAVKCLLLPLQNIPQCFNIVITDMR